MTEPLTLSEAPTERVATATPGDLIREARAKSGLHIVALAAALKVPVRKLEALEANRWTEVGDPTFIRALASSVARHLKINPASVLAGLPASHQVQLGIPEPLTSSVGASRGTPSDDHPRPWLHVVVVALLVGATGLYFAPQLTPQLEMVLAWVQAARAPVASLSTSTVSEPLAVAVVAPGGHSPSVQVSGGPVQSPEPTAAATAAVPDTSPAGAVPAGPLPTLKIKGVAETWVEVVDAAGRLRIQRVVAQGEEVEFEGGAPFAVVIGRIDATEVRVRGTLMDLAAFAKSNVARFEVK